MNIKNEDYEEAWKIVQKIKILDPNWNMLDKCSQLIPEAIKIEKEMEEQGLIWEHEENVEGKEEEEGGDGIQGGEEEEVAEIDYDEDTDNEPVEGYEEEEGEENEKAEEEVPEVKTTIEEETKENLPIMTPPSIAPLIFDQPEPNVNTVINDTKFTGWLP